MQQDAGGGGGDADAGTADDNPVISIRLQNIMASMNLMCRVDLVSLIVCSYFANDNNYKVFNKKQPPLL